MKQVFAKNVFCNLLLNLKLNSHLSETILKLVLQHVRLLLKFYLHFLHLGLVDSIFRIVLHHFVHLNDHLSAQSNFIDNITFLPDVMIFM